MARIRTSTKRSKDAMGISRQQARHRHREEGEDEEDNDEQVSDEDSQRQPNELDVSAAEIMRNPVSAGCLKAYTNQNILFLLYALKLDTELLTDEALTAFQLANEESAQQLEKESNKARRHVASKLLSSNVCPVKMELITGQHFLRYLLSLCKSSTNTRLSHSSYQAKRAALFHLFRSYNARQPDNLQKGRKKCSSISMYVSFKLNHRKGSIKNENNDTGCNH
jgi:hypothetical protein